MGGYPELHRVFCVSTFLFMAKDPAVLFYTSDFLSGTFTMNNEQVGKYIRLLCLQHQNGRLTDKDMLNICGSYDIDVYSKFVKDGEFYYNEKMKNESERRKKYTESRSKNRNSHTEQPNKQPVKNEKSYVKHMETGTETITETINTTKTEIFVNPFGENFTAWQGWKDYKREEHREHYRSPKTEQAAANKLFKLARGNPETAIVIIQQSIENRWKGLFELKTQNNGTTKTEYGSPERAAEYERLFAKRYGNR